MTSFVRISFVSAALLVACGATVAELQAREASSAALVACRTSAEILCKRVGECAPDAPAPYNAAASAPCSVLADPERGFWNGPVDALLSFCEVSPGRFGNLESCLRDGDCASGWCEDSHPRDACDRCGLRAGEGEPCNARTRCRAGLRCGHEDRCERIPDEPLGEPCGSTNACHWTLECIDGTCRQRPLRTSCTAL